jgi:tetratricopeptide (TPR) repeat protein
MFTKAPLKWLLAAVLLLPSFSAVAEESVSAKDGSVAAGRDIRDSNITIGLSPKQVRDYMLEVLREESTAQEKVEELSHQLNVTHEAVVNFFKILNQREVPLEKLPEALAEIAQRHQELLARLAALDPKDPAIKALTDEARAAMEAGDYNRADAQLHQAEVAELTAARQADALSDYGEIKGDNVAFHEAITIYQKVLGLFTRKRSPLEWARAQVSLGNTLRRLGEREVDTIWLEQAVIAFQVALEELTRKRSPLEWARAQVNLGTALSSLGERESDTAQLCQRQSNFDPLTV